jgi:hypothetical protein
MNARQTQRTVTGTERVDRKRAVANTAWTSIDQMKITGDGLLTVKVR